MFDISIQLNFFVVCYSEVDAADRIPEKTKRTERIYECKECSERSCRTTTDFRAHYLTHLKTEKEKDVMDIHSCYNLLYRCLPCDLILPEVEVKKHRARHKQRRRSVCDICGMVFTLRGSWFAHRMKHKAEETGDWFECKMCGQTFALQFQLKNHMAKHTNKRPYVCEVCGKAFKAKHILDRHRHVHSDIKPFSCEFCGKGFTSNCNLKSHLRTHTGEKPFKCDVCDASFTHNVSLKTHKKSTHGIDLWKIQKSSKLQEFDIDFDELRCKKFERIKVETATKSTASPDENPTVKTSRDTSVERKEKGILQNKSRQKSTATDPNMKEDIASTSQDFVTVPFEPLVDSSQKPQEPSNAPQSGKDGAGVLPVLLNPFLMHNIQELHAYNLSGHDGSDFDRRSGEPSYSQLQRATDQWTHGKQFTDL